jgi:ribokinase
VHIVAVGDVMLDVIVEVPAGLRHDDDTEATITLSAGGQAANVATWAVELGAVATVIGPRGDTEAADLVAERLRTSGVAYAGVPVVGGGTVVSLVGNGTRTMASDAGDQSWLPRISPSDLPDDSDWLHLSAYPLLRAADATGVLDLCFEARAQGTRVSVDLASAALITSFGADAFAALVTDLRVDLIFATAAEWQVVARLLGHQLPAEVVIKRGVDGIEVWGGGTATTFDASPVDVVDATGAGDAFAAGYLIGGVDLGLATAARCLGRRGAQPAPGQETSG